jgi:hypothetical protein
LDIVRYPSDLTTYGPSQLAIASGMRRQASMSSLYFALLGLCCGTLSRL